MEALLPLLLCRQSASAVMSVVEMLPLWHQKSNSYHLSVIKIYKKDDLVDTISLNNCQYILFGRKKDPTSDSDPSSHQQNGICLSYVLDHQSISRKHAVIFFGENNLTYLMDLGSSHGTLVDGRPLTSNQPFLLSDNSLIQFGQSTRRYSYCRNEHRPSVPTFQETEATNSAISALDLSSSSSSPSAASSSSSSRTPLSTSAPISASTPSSVSVQQPSASLSTNGEILLTKEEQRKKRQQEIASYALEMSSTVPIFTSTKKTLSKAEMMAAAQVPFHSALLLAQHRLSFFASHCLLPSSYSCHLFCQSNPDFEGASIEYLDQDMGEEDPEGRSGESDEEEDSDEDDKSEGSVSTPADLPPPMTDLESLAFSRKIPLSHEVGPTSLEPCSHHIRRTSLHTARPAPPSLSNRVAIVSSPALLIIMSSSMTLVEWTSESSMRPPTVTF
jgi:pSer/pThr/pTyr-binding forkhead associated (FHA) protein